MKLIKHIRRWNIWRKRCSNGPLHKFLVLIGFIHSPTMYFILLPEEAEEIHDGILRGLRCKASVFDDYKGWED